MVHLRTCTEVRGRLERTIPRVILCDSDLPDGNWKDVLEMAASLHDPPPVIVTSRLADEYLWAEVLNLGGYDVLSKPLDARELERTLRLAWERRPDPQDLQTRATGTRIQNGDSKICSTA
jgi:DNA-binding response OmpR family regulator